MISPWWIRFGGLYALKHSGYLLKEEDDNTSAHEAFKGKTIFIPLCEWPHHQRYISCFCLYNGKKYLIDRLYFYDTFHFIS
jgi:hypothetical protein